ncbi:MAG: type IV pilus assembly protein PilM [Rubripirellula sp.]
MARSSSGVWGIEIGQTALKALRCSLVDGEPVADAFDFIEYPKILSQPEAVAEELVADALEQLLERNDAISEKVCISVPGQSGLAKFFKPPPVEVKKIADIVRYEARQQIPFDLADVVWDFQMMPGSMVEEGYALESEVGLFAMKREQAYRQMTPFDEANIEVDQVQLAPLALYNMLAFDRMHERVDAGVFDSDDPPPSTVLLSIGTDSSDLIVTNGFRIWQRSMPIGGNHFTRQLTKDLKMTFAKAEHLKRNAREAVDPKLIFQTMRPVFNDLVTEVQRSIGFFRSIDKKADIKELIVTGNTVKMPGLAAYLGKNLGFDVHVLDRFNRLGGEDVLSIPTFRDNIPTFAVCYGLCLQGLGVSQIHASLVPREILTQRMIRAKKPWTLAGLAALMVGMSAHYVLTEKSWATTHDDLWKAPQAEVTRMKAYSDEHLSDDANLNSKLTYLNDIGKEVSGDSEARLKWLEIMKVVNDVIPRPDFPDGKILGPKELPYLDRKDFHVKQFETKYYEDLSLWYTEKVARRYRDEYRSWARITGNPVPEDLNEDLGPTGPGWVIQLNCYHYYNSPDRIGFEGSNHVRNLMTTSFLKSSVELPIGTDANGKRIMETFTLPEMGLTYPLLLDDNKDQLVSIVNPDYDAEAIMAEQMKLAANGEAPTPASELETPMLQVRKLDFIYQVVWQEKILSERLEAKEAARLLAEEEAAATAAAEESAVIEE